MKTRVAAWALTLLAGLGVLAPGNNTRAVVALGSSRFNDWQDQGCLMTPGGAGAPASGASSAGGNQAHCVPCGGATGMAAWWVDEPYLNLWVVDEPLSYLTSSGQPITFRWTYRPREGFASGDWRARQWDGAYLVPMRIREAKESATMESAAWCHNWWSEIVVWDTWFETHPGSGPTLSPMPTPTNAYCSFSTSYEVLAFLGDGSTLYFNGVTAGTPNGNGKVRLEMLAQSTNNGPQIPLSQTWNGIRWPYGTDTNGVLWVDNPRYGFRLVYPDGSQDVYGFVYLMPWATWPAQQYGLCPYRDLVPPDPRCSAGSDGTNTWNAAYDYTARAYLTQRIDPQGRITRLGYQYTTNSSPTFYLRYVVDPDGRTNSYSYNVNNLYQLQQIVDAWGRTNSVTYSGGTEGLLASITDGGGLTSSFQYQAGVWGTNYYYGYTNAWCWQVTNVYNGWITNLTTPYGTTSFTWLENPGTNGFDADVERALLASEPAGAHQLYYYRHNGQGLLANWVTSVPVVPGYALDTGTNGQIAPELYWRNSLHWDRRQFAALSLAVQSCLVPSLFGQVNLAGGVGNLSAADYRKANLQHWLLGSDGFSVSGSVSSQRDPSPDAAGQIEGVRTWYDYAGKDANNPEMESTQPLLGCLARLLPDGSSQYVEWDYTGAGYPSQQRSTYAVAGGVGVRTNVYGYATNGVDLLSVTNSLGQYVNLGYNTNHQVRFVTNALGQVSQAVYDPGTGNLTNLSLASGQGAALSYYPPASPPGRTNSLLESVTLQPQGLTIQTSDYTNGLPRVVQTSGTGLPSLTVTNFWDGLNRLIGTAYPDGTTTSNVYNRLYLGAAKDRLGYWTSYGYDPLQHLTSVTDPLTNVTTLGWCDCGALSSITNALTNVTSFSYNNQGLLSGIVFGDSSSLTYGYDGIGRLTSVTDGANRALFAGYNNQGLLTTVSNANGSLGGIVYDAADRPEQVTDANNVTVGNQFDLLNRLTARYWPDNAVEGFGWATNGLIAYTNRSGKVTRLARDDAGRLTGVTNANQERTLLGYNALSQVTDLWDGRTNHTTWYYNQYGWLSNKVDALNHEVLRYSYYANGAVSNRWTPQVGNTLYGWDGAGNLRTITYPQSSISYAYDALNRLKTMMDAVGTNTFGYTAAGLLQSEAGPSATLTYTYTQGLRTSLSLDSLGFGYGYDSAWRLQTLTSPAGTFGYTYEAQRSTLPTLLALPNGAWVTNHYDSLARLDYTALVNPWGHVLDGYGYGYDLAGLRTSVVRDLGLTNSSVSVGYDSIGQLTSWQAREDLSGPVRLNEQFNYVYDQAGNLRYRTNGGLVQTFNCDPVNQITNITRSGTLTVSGATPAPATNVTVNGQTAQLYGDFTFACTNLTLTNGQNTFTIIAANTNGLRATNSAIYNLPSSIPMPYDSNGNLTNDGTRSFAYDAENRLLSNWVAGAWSTAFVYDGLGRRRIERDYAWSSPNWQLTNELLFIYDGWQLVQVRDGSNNVLVTYTRGLDLSGSLAGAGGIGGLLARTDGSGSAFYHADGAGNITGLIDGQENMAARYMYGPFGRLVGQWGPMANVNEMQFSSMPVDRLSGMPHFPFRDYEPSLQQFLTDDPIGEAGGIPLHGFVGNSPLNAVDPYGLWWWDRGLIQIGLPQKLHDIFIGDRPPPVVDPNSYGAMHGIDLTVTGGQRPGDFIADQAMEVAKDSALAMAMLTPGLGEEEGAAEAGGGKWLKGLAGKCKKKPTGLPKIFGSRGGTTAAEKVAELKNAMLGGKYRFTDPEGQIGGWINPQGEYMIGEGHNRMQAALDAARESGDMSYVQQLLQNGRWTRVNQFPTPPTPLPPVR